MKLRTPLLAACAAALAIVATSSSQAAGTAATPQYYAMPSNGGPPLPFSEAVQVGNILYLSGQIGFQPGTTKLVPGGVVPEARQTLENIKSTLERHGSSMDHLVKCTIMLADIGDWPAFNNVYKEFFKGSFPARSAMAVGGLAFGARTEIECIAFVPG